MSRKKFKEEFVCIERFDEDLVCNWYITNCHSYKGYGFIIKAKVYDLEGNFLYSDAGESYEFYYNAQYSKKYRKLAELSEVALKKMGITNNNIMKDYQLN